MIRWRRPGSSGVASTTVSKAGVEEVTGEFFRTADTRLWLGPCWASWVQLPPAIRDPGAAATRGHENVRRNPGCIQIRPEGSWALAQWNIPGAPVIYPNATDVIVDRLAEHELDSRADQKIASELPSYLRVASAFVGRRFGCPVSGAPGVLSPPDGAASQVLDPSADSAIYCLSR